MTARKKVIIVTNTLSHGGAQRVAVRLANAYPAARLVLIHWGTVDAPDMTPFNANPRDLYARIINPERICPLWPGEEFAL